MVITNSTSFSSFSDAVMFVLPRRHSKHLATLTVKSSAVALCESLPFILRFGGPSWGNTGGWEMFPHDRTDGMRLVSRKRLRKLDILNQLMHNSADSWNSWPARKEICIWSSLMCELPAGKNKSSACKDLKTTNQDHQHLATCPCIFCWRKVNDTRYDSLSSHFLPTRVFVRPPNAATYCRLHQPRRNRRRTRVLRRSASERGHTVRSCRQSLWWRTFSSLRRQKERKKGNTEVTSRKNTVLR